MVTDIKEIIRINTQRNEALNAPYDPVSGTGSLMERSLVQYTDEEILREYYAPRHVAEMEIIQELCRLGSIEKLVEESFNGYSRKNHELLRKKLFELRLREDFEFYAFTCVTIPEKDSDQLIPFKLNRPQRKLLRVFESQRIADQPIRVIIDKARQWGGSTATQIYMNWIQLFHKKRWHMAICTLVDAQAIHIRQMLNTTLEHLPEGIGKFTLSNYGGFNAKNKIINERDCIIGVGSTERPENLRGYNIRMCHLSEAGSWKDTPSKSAKALIQTLRGSVRKLPYTMIVMESTAKGVGNFFHDEWTQAIEGKSGYEPVFVAWWEIEMYREKITDYEKFISDLNEYGWNLWNLGATLEGINWYFNHKRQENMSDLSMYQEFPSTSQESFESTGRPAFNNIHIQRQYKHCRPPVFIGDIRGNGTKGKEAFEKLEFVEQKDGNLWIWEYPDDTMISNRYVGALDIGGRTKKADYSCLKVIDRYWMMDGGKPEVVAMWWGHLDQDLLAWKAAQVMYAYNKGLFAVEIQSLRKKGESYEGDHSLTILDEIAPFYPNLYARNSPDDIRPGMPSKWGFSTNILTKPMIIDTLNEALRDDLYKEMDKGSLDEMYYYELKDDGTYGAADGKHDDKVISTAMGLWLAIKYMPRPAEIIMQQRTQRRIVSEASI